MNTLETLTEQIDNTEFQGLMNEVEELKTQIETKVKEKQPLEEARDALNTEIKRLEKEIKDFERERERKTKEMKDKIKKQKAKMQTMKKVMSKAKSDKTKKEMEIKNMEKENEEMAEKRKEIELEISKAEENLNSLKDQHLDLKKELKRMTDGLESAQKEMENESNELEAIRERIQKSEDQRVDLENEIDRLKEEENRIRRNKEIAASRVREIEKRNKWVLEERDYFGKAGSDFDFTKHPKDLVKKKAAEYEKKLQSMDGKVNKQVQEQFARNNEEAKELRKKKRLVDEDRKTLENVIKSLEEKKKHAVETVYKKVNKFFNQIFSKLLPGTQCKLVPLPGKTIHEGLEIKVAFGDEWRESLSELSGGQKSLLSLSLILALLKHKPAPMYILDEIDSALDLSHTQNIGVMLKTHFNDSQFIVVSLKSGLFQNANVLFKTRLSHGVSQVDRSRGGGASS